MAMTTVLSNKNDINTLAQLWKQGFGDSASFIDWYFSNRYAEDLSSVTKDGEEIVSMAFCQPMAVKMRGRDIPAVMLNGVYTIPEYRKKGLMHENVMLLEKTASKKGALVMINTPAGKNHYASLGHRYITSCDRKTIEPIEKNSSSHWKMEACAKIFLIYPNSTAVVDQTLDAYNSMASNFSCMVKRTPDLQKERFDDYLSDNAKLIGCFDGDVLSSYAVVYELEEKYVSPECVFSGSSEEILHEISKLDKPCEVKLPGKSKPTAVGTVLNASGFLKCFNLPFSLEVTDDNMPENNGVFSMDSQVHRPCARLSSSSLIEIFSGYLDFFDTDDIIIYDRGDFNQLRSFLPKENCYMIEEY